jgi:hypothetical protein
MDVNEHGAATAGSTAAVVTGAATVASRRSWSVVNMDSRNQTAVLVTRWRWYAGWWAACLRIFDGDDMKIVRTR